MTAAHKLLLLPGVIGAMLALMILTRHFGRRWNWPAELSRKTVHVAAGLVAIALPWLLGDGRLVFAFLAATLLVLAILRLPALAGGLGAVVHGVERQSYGDILLVLAVAMVFVLSGGSPVLYVLPLAVLTLADAAAALAGTSYGRIRFRVEDGQKSLEGSLVFFATTWLLAMILLLLMTGVPRENVVLLSFVVAGYAAVVEADSWRGLDNLFVPLGILFVLQRNLDSGLPTLAALVIGFIAALVFFRTFAPLLGFNAHTARAHVAGFFMIGSVTAIQNAILPSLALIMHAAARTKDPSDASHPDLDALALTAVLSLAWLVAGTVLGVNALAYYALTFAGLAVLFAMLAVRKERTLRGLLDGAGALVVIGAILSGVLLVNQATAANAAVAPRLAEMFPWAALALLPTAGVPLLAPGFFRRRRAGRAALVAVAVPGIAYGWKIVERGVLP